jgi:hypothetical protein
MRNARAVLAVTLVAVLVFALSPVAIATATPRRPAPAALPYHVTLPHVDRVVVTAGTPFAVSGSVVPTIPADDTAMVALRVIKLPSGSQVATVPATLTGPDAKGTGWTASVTYPTAGSYALLAVVVKDGRVIGKSPVRFMLATFPYRVTGPRVASRVVHVGDSFEASGSVIPTIAPDDVATTVALEVLRLGDGRPYKVATVPATLTGPVGKGTGYSAMLSLPKPGEYALVAVVMRDGNVVGRSDRRPILAVLPYRVSKPRVASSVVATGTDFDATGSVVPTITPEDNASVFIQVFRMRPRGARSLVSTVTASFTGPVGKGTGYSATLSLPSTGSYVLVAVVYKGDTLVGRSEGRPMLARCLAAVHKKLRTR